MPILFAMASGIIKVIVDAFTRTTSGSLGVSDSGRSWSAVKGTWYANGSSAQSDDAASNYSLASQLLYANGTMSADVSGGVGLSYWVVDANNWWASYPNYVQNSYTSSSCTGGTVSCTDTTNTCTPTNSCGSITVTSSPAPCAAYYSYDPGTNTCNGTLPFMDPPSYTPATNYTRSSASLVTSTYYTYDTQIKVISSVSGSVVTQSTTTLVSGAGSLSTVGSLKVTTSGNQITTTAYTGTGLVSQLGSSVLTPTSPTLGTSVGIIKAPSNYNQGSTLDNFSAKA